MAVIEPTKGKKERAVPAHGLLLVNPTEARPQLDLLLASGGRRQFLFNSGLVIDKERQFFLAGPAVGAPMAVMTLEKLIALGAKQIILCGWCGAISPTLKVGDLVVPTSALVGEGTSQYYGCDTETTPSTALSCQLAGFFEGDLTPHRGRIWSTDGIYREEREYLLSLNRDHQVLAVDMEFSALCSAAAFRKVDFAAILTVSDMTTGKRWQPGFNSEVFLHNKELVLQRLIKNAAQIKG